MKFACQETGISGDVYVSEFGVGGKEHCKRIRIPLFRLVRYNIIQEEILQHAFFFFPLVNYFTFFVSPMGGKMHQIQYMKCHQNNGGGVLQITAEIACDVK